MDEKVNPSPLSNAGACFCQSMSSGWAEWQGISSGTVEKLKTK